MKPKYSGNLLSNLCALRNLLLSESQKGSPACISSTKLLCVLSLLILKAIPILQPTVAH
jgi:hypothetical protein